ncbi:hypothetical protein CHISP_1805 [Chitinispirillum alkaliphilum]|nr:hypothetical protein CHISP_1805 [Chitinispirillum alkaliphilum]
MSSGDNRLWYRSARSFGFFMKGQIAHLFAILILIPVVWAFAAPVMDGGTIFGVRDTTWFWLAVGIPVFHQTLVWIVFRAQLGWAAFSKLFGHFDLFVWGVLFLPLLVLRPILIVGLALVTERTLMLSKIISISLALILIVPSLYTLWSVIRYFGLIRAMGGDHFRISFRKMPLVRQGAFKYSANAMYTFAFFLLWSVALIIGSQAALSVALFEHAYIWVHYYCTEKPDMEIIYGS